MAIAVDATSIGTPTTATTNSWNHTVGSGSSRALVVANIGGISSDLVTGIKWNTTESFVKIGSSVLVPGVNGRYLSLWYILNPTSGTHSITITNSSSEYSEPFAVSYAGFTQSGQPDANTTNTAASGSSDVTTSVTTVADNCWTVLFAVGRAADIGAGTGSTSRSVNAGGAGIFDSNAALTPAGSKSMTITRSGATEAGMIMASFSPATSSPSSSPSPSASSSPSPSASSSPSSSPSPSVSSSPSPSASSSPSPSSSSSPSPSVSSSPSPSASSSASSSPSPSTSSSPSPSASPSVSSSPSPSVSSSTSSSPSPSPSPDAWSNQTKSSSTFANQTKNTSTFTNSTKNTSIWSNQTKT